MGISFQLAKIPLIHFGPGKIQQLGKEITRFGKNALIVTAKDSFKNEAINQIIEKSGVNAWYICIENEPSPLLIDTICADYRDKGIEVVAGIGGGSVMDAGKAISAMLRSEGSVKEYLEGVGTKIHPGTKIPYIAIPTTSGTGSETTSNAVLSETGIQGFKKSLRHANFVPDVAIVDPELTLTCPKELTAATGLDAFTQLLESYLSLKSSPVTDALAIEGLRQIERGLKKSYNKGTDLEARSSLAYASMTSGITLTNAGLGTVHGFASAIGGYFRIPHGVVCGTLMAASNDFTVKKLRKANPENPALKKYASVGRLFSKETRKSDDFYIDLLINTLHELTEYLSIPGLGNYRILESDLSRICDLTENKNNPVEFSKIELAEILRSRL